ncbi:unnamed protein product [Vitrella brassicaformis CCMP3155]|uniref:Uncharacterized protein n=1 Tax=Vitrella brassicaformis (strain CCMP3155) TaxID=1169540 RepID=A0A0G4FVU3_VITBC|nr:unnamed protein product [Vitrella brassicaformis CCMP3155]|eukprot:CEM18718.1 unnamed protein product [Vitrella brassicaformis CCMP3155]
MVLKALMTTQEVKANQLEPLFNSAVIKHALYRLITECIRNSPPSDESEDDLTAAYGGASPTDDSMNTQLLMYCLPPLVTRTPQDPPTPPYPSGARQHRRHFWRHTHTTPCGPAGPRCCSGSHPEPGG